LTIRFADFRHCAVQASGLVSYGDLRLGKLTRARGGELGSATTTEQ